MRDTMLRQWAVLRAIPKYPRRLDASTIHSQLTDRGINVTIRTVQRDLTNLAQAFPLDFDECRPQGWCWRQGAGQLDIPGMDVHAALTFNLVEQYMQHLLPRSTLSHMAPWFNAAHGVTDSDSSTVSKWRTKVRVVQHTFHKIPPPIDPVIQSTVYNGLLNERQLEVTYRAITSGKEAKTYPVHPLGLVVMEQVVYLVCTVRDYQDARFLAMHRLDNARCLDTLSSRPADFDIDEFILHEFGIRLDLEPLLLVLRIRGVMAKYLAETPISAHQTLTPLEGEWTQVQVEVLDTIQLRTWLRSLGPDAVVEEPLHLRHRLKAEWAELQSLYSDVH